MGVSVDWHLSAVQCPSTVDFKLHPESRIAITVDLNKYIALRMSERSDVDVFNLAMYIQSELDSVLFVDGNGEDTVDNLVNVAQAVKRGSAAFYKTISHMSEMTEVVEKVD